MKRIHSPARFLVIGWLISVATPPFATAQDWPKGYMVFEGTESPDDRYGILVPTYEAWDKNEADEEVNYFADVKNHRVLGKIAGADYYEHQNHRALNVTWNDDSSWCVVQYDGRFGFSTISIIEPKETTFVQTDVGKRINKSLSAAIKSKGDGDEDSGGDANAYYRFDSNKVIIRAATTTDPKEMDIKHARYAYFRGTFDVRSKKWLSADSRRLDYETYSNSDSALLDIDTDEEIPATSEADTMLQALDGIMNRTYEFLHSVLPPARFGAIKKEQIEWLKKRDAASTTQEKCKLLQERIKALQDFLW